MAKFNSNIVAMLLMCSFINHRQKGSLFFNQSFPFAADSLGVGESRYENKIHLLDTHSEKANS